MQRHFRSFSLTPEQDAEIKRRARAAGLTVSAYCRERCLSLRLDRRIEDRLSALARDLDMVPQSLAEMLLADYLGKMNAEDLALGAPFAARYPELCWPEACAPDSPQRGEILLRAAEQRHMVWMLQQLEEAQRRVGEIVIKDEDLAKLRRFLPPLPESK